MDIAKEDLDFLFDLARKNAGIDLGSEKAYLLESRLNHILRKHNLADFKDLIRKVKESYSKELVSEITEALLTNETSFFRDGKPFDLLFDTLIPQILAANPAKSEITIWCAACSSGQEPYSIAIRYLEKILFNKFKLKIIATDLSQQVLEKAKSGRYSQFEVQRGLSVASLLKFFTQDSSKEWVLNDEVKNLVDFREFNLMESLYPFGKLDIVFCRNVLIYFSQQTKEEIVKKIVSNLNPSGYLILGSSEASNNYSPNLEPSGLFPGFFTLKK